MQVRQDKREPYGRNLPGLFAWMGKRIQATQHLALHVEPDGWPTEHPEDLLSHLLSSGRKPNAHMGTLDLTLAYDNPYATEATLMAGVRDCVLAHCSRLGTVSLPLEKAPSWLMDCLALRHVCLFFPRHQTERGLFSELPTLNSKTLPNLQTLMLHGSNEPLEIRCVNFQDSERLEVAHLQDCWVEDLSLPPCCRICVSAQVSNFIVHMDEAREHLLVSKASYQCLPNDLAERVAPEGFYLDDEFDQFEEEGLQKISTPDVYKGNPRHVSCTAQPPSDVALEKAPPRLALETQYPMLAKKLCRAV